MEKIFCDKCKDEIIGVKFRLKLLRGVFYVEKEYDLCSKCYNNLVKEITKW